MSPEEFLQGIKEIRVDIRMAAKQVRFDNHLNEDFAAGYLSASLNAEKSIDDLVKLYERTNRV